MLRKLLRKSLVVLGLIGAGAVCAASRNLEISWIDAEGGAATLIVSPSGQSMLVDTANRTPDDRDAKRIYAAAQQAGLKKIDILLTTHYHGDHIGAMQALSKMIPIGEYMDHGESVEIETRSHERREQGGRARHGRNRDAGFHGSAHEPCTRVG